MKILNSKFTLFFLCIFILNSAQGSLQSCEEGEVDFFKGKKILREFFSNFKPYFLDTTFYQEELTPENPLQNPMEILRLIFEAIPLKNTPQEDPIRLEWSLRQGMLDDDDFEVGIFHSYRIRQLKDIPEEAVIKYEFTYGPIVMENKKAKVYEKKNKIVKGEGKYHEFSLTPPGEKFRIYIYEYVNAELLSKKDRDILAYPLSRPSSSNRVQMETYRKHLPKIKKRKRCSDTVQTKVKGGRGKFYKVVRTSSGNALAEDMDSENQRVIKLSLAHLRGHKLQAHKKKKSMEKSSRKTPRTPSSYKEKSKIPSRVASVKGLNYSFKKKHKKYLDGKSFKDMDFYKETESGDGFWEQVPVVKNREKLNTSDFKPIKKFKSKYNPRSQSQPNMSPQERSELPSIPKNKTDPNVFYPEIEEGFSYLNKNGELVMAETDRVRATPIKRKKKSSRGSKKQRSKRD